MERDVAVAAICRIAADSKAQGRSALELFREAESYGIDQVSDREIEAYLRGQPELVESWVENSADQRTSGAWWIVEPIDPTRLKLYRENDLSRRVYLQFHAEGKWTVGKGVPETDRSTFDDKFNACAFYIRRRIEELAEWSARTKT